MFAADFYIPSWCEDSQIGLPVYTVPINPRNIKIVQIPSCWLEK